MNRHTRIASIAAIAATLVVLSGVNAHANDGTGRAIEAIEAVTAATDETLDLATLSPPATIGDRPALVSSTPLGASLEMRIVDEHLTSSRSAGDAVVFSTDVGHDYVAVSSDTNPGAISAVLTDRTRTEFRYDVTIDGRPAELEHSDGGFVRVLSTDGELQNLIKPAWAIDAAGTAIPTEYRIDGSSLVQLVHTSGDEALPIVADAGIACNGLFCTAEMNRAETRNVAFYGGVGGAVASICAVLLPAAGWPAAVCAAAIIAMTAWVQGTAADAYGQGKCLGIRALIYTPTATMHPAIYGPGGNCR